MINLRRGLNHLTTIAAVAPMLGLLGTITGIFAAALFPLAYALLLTIATKWAYTYLYNQASNLSLETNP